MKTLLIFLFSLSSLSMGGKSPLKFDLKDFEGKNHSLEDFKGKVVVIDFWAVWCVTCRKVFPVLNELKKKYSDKEVEILGISIDEKPPEYVQKFVKKVGIDYKVLLDPKGKSPKKFGINVVPTLFVLDPNGDQILMKEGFEGEKEGLEIDNAIQNGLKIKSSQN